MGAGSSDNGLLLALFSLPSPRPVFTLPLDFLVFDFILTLEGGRVKQHVIGVDLIRIALADIGISLDAQFLQFAAHLTAPSFAAKFPVPVPRRFPPVRLWRFHRRHRTALCRPLRQLCRPCRIPL